MQEIRANGIRSSLAELVIIITSLRFLSFLFNFFLLIVWYITDIVLLTNLSLLPFSLSRCGDSLGFIVQDQRTHRCFLQFASYKARTKTTVIINNNSWLLFGQQLQKHGQSDQILVFWGHACWSDFQIAAISLRITASLFAKFKFVVPVLRLVALPLT